MRNNFNKLLAGSAVASLVFLSACGGGAPADLMGLPEDDAERATLCGRAAVAFASSGALQGVDKAEEERRAGLLQEIVDATDFFGVTGKSETEGQTYLSDIEATLTGGNWLTTLNQCKAAYELGDAEPVPELPEGPAEQAAACGAAAMLANLDGKSIDDIDNMLEDPQAGYFITIVAGELNGDFAASEQALTKQIEAVVTGGAVGTLKDACLTTYPKAKPGAEVTLPSNDEEAVSLCAFASSMTGEMSEEAKARGDAMIAKLEKVPGGMVTAARAKQLEAGMYKVAADAGLAPDVLNACEKRYK